MNNPSYLIVGNEASDLEPTIEELGCGWKRILPGSSDQVDIREFHALVVRGWAYPLPAVYPESLYRLMREFQKAGKGIFVEYTPAETDGEAPPAVAYWERLFVPGEHYITQDIGKMGILDENASIHVPMHNWPTSMESNILCYGKVAGLYTAEYGQPPGSYVAVYPALMASEKYRIVRSSTVFCDFTARRYRPTGQWRAVLRRILLFLLEEKFRAEVENKYMPLKICTFPRIWAEPCADVKLQIDTGTKVDPKVTISGKGLAIAEDKTGAWQGGIRLDDGRHVFEVESGYRKAKVEIEIMPRAARYLQTLKNNMKWFETSGVLPKLDGTAGVLEGLVSVINYDGKQYIMPAFRSDCNGECGSMFMLYGKLFGLGCMETRGRNILTKAEEVLQFHTKNHTHGYFLWTCMGKPQDPEKVNGAVFSADSARGVMGQLGSYQLAKQAGAVEATDLRALKCGLRGTEALFRIMNKRGEWPSNTSTDKLLDLGWDHHRLSERGDAGSHIYPATTMLISYALTGHDEYLRAGEKRVREDVEKMNNGEMPAVNLEPLVPIAILLPSALLWKYTGDKIYEAALDKMIKALQAMQTPEGIFVQGGERKNISYKSNEEFAKNEIFIRQWSDDPITDQLYETSFEAFFLTSAFRITGKEEFRKLAEPLVDYLSRIQVVSDDPMLNGAWMRAFDYRAWEYYGITGDIGWGPYCVETGWMCSLINLSMMQLLGDLSIYPGKVDPDRKARQALDEVLAEFREIEREWKPIPVPPGGRGYMHAPCEHANFVYTPEFLGNIPGLRK